MAGKIILVIVLTVVTFLFGQFQTMPIPADVEDNILWVPEVYPSFTTNDSLAKLKHTLKSYSDAYDDERYHTRNGISTSTTVSTRLSRFRPTSLI